MKNTGHDTYRLFLPFLLFALLFSVGTVFLHAFRSLTNDIRTAEPLADPDSLRRLMLGLPLPQPAEEPYGKFLGSTVKPIPLSALTQINRVLGLTTNDGKKWIAVDLTNQSVYAFEGTQKVMTFTVSTGKWGRTPTGEFTIWVKVRSQKMEGGNPAIGTYYYLPNVPYVMFFYNDEIAKSRGFSFHGAYWHNNFGHPMSHGCINMKIDDAKTLYDWADPAVTNTKAWSTLASKDVPGTRVVIYGETPRE